MKRTRLITLHPDGRVEVEIFQGTDKEHLARLQELVGGFIETVPAWNTWQGRRCVVYCNEEGLLTHLQRNEQATTAWRECLIGRGLRVLADHAGGEGSLVGTVVIEQAIEENEW